MRAIRMCRDLGPGVVTLKKGPKASSSSAQVLVLSLFSRLALEPKFKKPRPLKRKGFATRCSEAARASQDALRQRAVAASWMCLYRLLGGSA